MATRKSNVLLTMEQKHKIIEELANGLAVSTIAAKYNVHSITIRRIRQSGARINQLLDRNTQAKNIKRLKKPVFEELENKLYRWFVEKRAAGDKITDALLLEKAAEIATNLKVLTFKGSRGWVTKFKKRHDIRLSKLYGEKKSADQKAADKFAEDFTNFVDKENIEFLQACEAEERRMIYTSTDDSDSAAYTSSEPEDDHDYLDYTEQRERTPSGRTIEDLDELKFIYDRLKVLCETDPPHIREMFQVLRRYHLEEYDKGTTQTRELGDSWRP